MCMYTCVGRRLVVGACAFVRLFLFVVLVSVSQHNIDQFFTGHCSYLPRGWDEFSQQSMTVSHGIIRMQGL